MAIKTTTDPKVPASADHAAKHGCCGGEAAAESKTGAAAATGHDHHEHAVPSKTVESSCGCGAKDGRPAT